MSPWILTKELSEEPVISTLISQDVYQKTLTELPDGTLKVALRTEEIPATVALMFNVMAEL